LKQFPSVVIIILFLNINQFQLIKVNGISGQPKTVENLNYDKYDRS